MDRATISERLKMIIDETIQVNLKKGVYAVQFFQGNHHKNLLKVGDYFDIRKGEISYCPKGTSQDIRPDGKWKRKNRQVIRAGKFFAMFTEYCIAVWEPSDEEVSDTAILNRAYEIMAAKIKAQDVQYEFYITGNISSVYEKDTADNAGKLSSSCMRPESSHNCRCYSNFYDELPGVKILFINDSFGEMIARALLWRTDQGFIYLDRIYSTEAVEQYLIALAKDRKWKYREYSSFPSFPMSYTSNVNLIQRSRTIEGTPYVDSLPYLISPNTLSNVENNRMWFIQSSNGHMINLEKCSMCGEYHSNYYNLYRNTDREDENVFICNNCMDDYRICCDCGRIILEEDSVQHPWRGSRVTCSPCSERYMTCPNCNNVTYAEHHTCAHCYHVINVTSEVNQ